MISQLWHRSRFRRSLNDRSGDEGKGLQIFTCTQKMRTSQESRTRTVPDHKNPGYQKRNRLRMSPILHPTSFADFALLYKIVCCLAMARQQLVLSREQMRLKNCEDPLYLTPSLPLDPFDNDPGIKGKHSKSLRYFIIWLVFVADITRALIG